MDIVILYTFPVASSIPVALQIPNGAEGTRDLCAPLVRPLPMPGVTRISRLQQNKNNILFEGNLCFVKMPHNISFLYASARSYPVNSFSLDEEE